MLEFIKTSGMGAMKVNRKIRFHRWTFLLAAALCAAAGAEAGKRIVVLRSGDLPIYSLAIEGFTEALRARKVAFTIEDKMMPDSGPGADVFMQGLRANPPDLLFTVGTSATRAALTKGQGLSVVYAIVVNPQGLGSGGAGAVVE